MASQDTLAEEDTQFSQSPQPPQTPTAVPRAHVTEATLTPSPVEPRELMTPDTFPGDNKPFFDPAMMSSQDCATVASK